MTKRYCLLKNLRHHASAMSCFQFLARDGAHYWESPIAAPLRTALRWLYET